MRAASCRGKPDPVRINESSRVMADALGTTIRRTNGKIGPPPCILSPDLCREARTLLDWEEGALAFAARVPPATVREFEAGGARPPEAALAALRRALEHGGVQFMPEDGTRGVTLRQ